MRIIIVWVLVVLPALAFITVVFYASTPVFMMLLENMNTTMNNWGITGDLQSAWNFAYNVLRYQWWWVFLMFVFGLLIWAVLSSNRREYESYGYPVE